MVTPTAPSAPDVVSMLDQRNISPGTWGTVIALASAFFLIPVSYDHQKQFAFS